jgi:hypothetical protein
MPVVGKYKFHQGIVIVYQHTGFARLGSHTCRSIAPVLCLRLHNISRLSLRVSYLKLFAFNDTIFTCIQYFVFIVLWKPNYSK